MSKFRPNALLGLVLLCVACGGPSTPSSNPLGLSVLPIAQGGLGELRHFPFAYDTPAGPLVAWSEHPDAFIADPIDAAGAPGRAPVRAQNFYLSGVVATGGVLYGVSYITRALDELSERAFGWLSRDGGVSWQPRPGTVSLPRPGLPREAGWGGMLFHRRLHSLPDGSIAGTLYGNFADDPRWYTTAWARSEDLGATWQLVSAVAAGPAGREGYAEPVSAVCPDRSILVVMRTGPDTPLRWARSRDGGRSWTTPAELPFVGWDPDLLLTPRGLLLAFGTPDRGPGLPARVHLARSSDCGETWRRAQTLEVPTSSGYAGLAHVGGQLVLFTDTDGETAIKGYPVEP